MRTNMETMPKTADDKVVEWRKAFPMLRQTMHGKPLIYLDSAASSLKPSSVIEAESVFYREQYGTVHRTIYELAVNATERFHEARQKIQAFLNAESPEEIIFTKGTTESINLVAYSFGKTFARTGDEILLTAMEHHSNIVPWQFVKEDRGIRLSVIPMNDVGELDLDAYASYLRRRPKLVSLTHVSNAIGTLNPIKAMIAMAHEAGAKVLIDAAQSVPHLPLDVQDLDADFLAFSGHKLYGPTGVGVLYGKRELLEIMHPYQGGGSMIQEVTFEKTTYAPPPLRFEAGTPMIAQAIGLGAAVDFVQELGLEEIESHEQALMRSLLPRLEEIEGLRVVGPTKERGALVSFVVDKVHALDLGTFLDLEGIAVRTGHHCAQPTLRHFDVPATTRVSLGLYNTQQEIDTFLSILQKTVAKLRSNGIKR